MVTTMRPIKNQSLAQLLMQVRFTPENKREAVLDSAEELFAMIDKAKDYPFDFVYFRITGIQPRGQEVEQLIKGEELLDEMRIFIARLSSRLARPVVEETEKVHTVEELAEMFGVATKTIRRWQKRGLMGRKYLFDGGTKRVGFLQSRVDEFVKGNPGLIERAKSFRIMTPAERRKIIKRAGKLAGGASLSRYQVIERIASETGRSHETIRYLLLDYENAHPEKAIFKKPAGVIDGAQAAEIYRLYGQGCAVKELMKRFNRSKSSIYRIVNRRRARVLLSRKIEFVASDEFLEERAAKQILGTLLTDIVPGTHENIEPFKAASTSLPEYLQLVKNAPVLNREREVRLFRRYNYVKYLACIKRAGIKPAEVSSARLGEIERCLAEGDEIKRMIIEANLRLVVGIARRHTFGGANLSDLVSEGNLSLMRAVEKFDYSRGFRFSTYASWSIAKDYARKIPAEAARRDRTAAASLAKIQQDLQAQDAADFAAMERARQGLAQVLRDELDEREQYVILNRFGPVGLPIKRKTKSLQQIGKDLGLSRERVRQLELVALQKLRQSLSPEEFELLTS
ncbi:MAG: sigma-70 family RNA polymerase sigma factor [Phycisphaerales bacterium]|nr:MAG: sigma-70 family RNA polymerase sigma factor [Phycisphaerales bacterium]